MHPYFLGVFMPHRLGYNLLSVILYVRALGLLWAVLIHRDSRMGSARSTWHLRLRRTSTICSREAYVRSLVCGTHASNIRRLQ